MTEETPQPDDAGAPTESQERVRAPFDPGEFRPDAGETGPAAADLLEDAGLDPDQIRAVRHVHGPLVVIAGPGSGKTRVLTHRIAHLRRLGRPGAPDPRDHVHQQGRQGDARRSLALLPGGRRRGARGRGLRRLAQLPRDLDLPQLLRPPAPPRDPPAAAVGPDFTIYDTGDQKGVVSEVLEALGVSVKNFTPGAALSSIGRWKNDMVDPDEAIDQAISHREKIYAKCYRGYRGRARGAERSTSTPAADRAARPQ